MNPERILPTLAKTLVAIVLWLLALIVLFRYGFESLWASRSDLGVLAAFPVLALGLIGLAYLAVKIIQYLRKEFTSNQEPVQ